LLLLLPEATRGSVIYQTGVAVIGDMGDVSVPMAPENLGTGGVLDALDLRNASFEECLSHLLGETPSVPLDFVLVKASATSEFLDHFSRFSPGQWFVASW